MAASLRTRLLWSYGLLVAVLLVLFSLGALLSLLGNPLVYENAADQLRTAQRIAVSRPGLSSSLSMDRTTARVQQMEALLKVRVVLVDAGGEQLADSQAGGNPPLVTPAARVNQMSRRNEIAFLHDASNRFWLGLVQPLDDQMLLLLAVRRPRLAFLQFFTSELIRPLIFTGLIGLALSLLISLALAGWISAPLQLISAAADDAAAGRYRPISPEGPVEVHRLAESFNHMVRRVQAAQQSQRDLVANVSHELKTPLTSIRGFTQAILDDVAKTPAEVHQAAEVILNESSRMSRLVQDLLSLSRLEAGTAELRREPVNISALVRAAVEKFRPHAVMAGLDLSADAPDLPWLAGDEDRLAQVLANLLDNAIKFTPGGGRVQVSARPVESGVQIRVSDTGLGIRPADRERIFERFFQAGGSRTGSGLGLAITHQIVMAHGGAIRVEENLPQGSVFIVDLPAAKSGQTTGQGFNEFS